jgi:hypothetical protein
VPPFASRLRASVGSTEAAKDVVARFGVIDLTHLGSYFVARWFCTPVTFDR